MQAAAYPYLLARSARTVEQLELLYSQPQSVASVSIPTEVIKSADLFSPLLLDTS